MAEIRFERTEAASEADRLVTTLREVVLGRLGRRGGIIWLSGGVESAVVAALCTRAFGKERVLGLLMEHDETPPALARRARELATHLAIPTVEEPLGPALVALGYHRRRDGAVAAFPQRLRKTLEYFHADRTRYAVIGATTRVLSPETCAKHGDVAADAKPIAHLYTTQVLQLAAQLELPAELCDAPSTEQLDACMYAHYRGIPATEVAAALGVPVAQIERMFRDLEARRAAARYLRARPILFGGGR